ncbi:hypothetical protein PPACK8108_LOCUS21162 [Phakopsora pachyrhizi]|uniref:Uncharacterized protein n=1 Tax=Phakopsora pachyrhizi TaxID=170000 RepID=A0AAV0BK41_PHAPC|nr:hypothetical protein PPACK8108_LOCUS21162 [Phakopsora pachyrhizi]
MTPLKNNTHLSSSPFPHPTVSLLCPIRSPPTFLNTNTGCKTEHNEREQDDNSNDNSEHNEEEDEEEDNDTNESEINLVDINMEASSLESNIITVNNPGIANSTQTVSKDQQANIAESQANLMHNPDSQEPHSMTGIQIPSQSETSNLITCNNISHQPTNLNASGDPNNIPSSLTVGPPDSNSTPFNSDLAINTAVTNSANTLIPKVPLPVPVFKRHPSDTDRNPFLYNFFIQSQASYSCLSRYIVLKDETNHTVDDLQNIANLASSGFQRAIKTVEIATPTNYANLVITRAKKWDMSDDNGSTVFTTNS